MNDFERRRFRVLDKAEITSVIAMLSAIDDKYGQEVALQGAQITITSPLYFDVGPWLLAILFGNLVDSLWYGVFPGTSIISLGMFVQR